MQTDNNDVLRVPSDLHNYRDRLDAGVQLGRRNRETVQELTDRVQQIRKRNAEEANLAQSLPQINVPSTSAMDRYSSNDRYKDSYKSDRSPRRLKQRHKSMSRLEGTYDRASPWSSDFIPSHHRSSPRLNTSSEEEYEDFENLFTKLKAELFKNSTLEEMNEMLRDENDAALQANEGLRSDVHGLAKALETLEVQNHNDQMRFQSENVRYRNQLENQHRQLIALWKAFTAVKRQVRELQVNATNDMDKQMTEFTRCASLMQRAIRQIEMKNKLREEENNREKDQQLEDIMKKFEQAAELQLKTEKELHEKSRQLTKLEEELRRKQEDNEEFLGIIGKIENMPELSSKTLRKRTRSASPSTSSPSGDVIRRIRTVLTTKARELGEVKEELEKVQKEKNRLMKDVEQKEKEHREKRDSQRKAEDKIAERDQRIKELEGDIRRLNERIQMNLEEKESREKVLLTLQENIANVHRSHKVFIEQLTARHAEELETREALHNTELEGKTQEEEAKTAKAQLESEKLREETETLKQQLRELRADFSTLKRDTDDKDFNLLTTQEDITNLKKKLELEAQKMDDKVTELAEMMARMEEMKNKEAELRNEIVEAKQVNLVLTEESQHHTEEIVQLRIDLADFQQKVDVANQTEEAYRAQIESYQMSSNDQDEAMKSLRVALQDLEIKLESTMENMHLCQNELDNTKDILKEKMNELTSVVKELEEANREKVIILDDLSQMKTELTSKDTEMASMDKQLKENNEKEDELRKLLEDLRNNFDRLTGENQQKQITIDDLQNQIEELNANLHKKTEEMKAEVMRYEETSKLKELEMEQNVKDQIDAVKKEKKKVEAELKSTATRLEELTSLHEKLMEEHMEQRDQLEQQKANLEEVTIKYKRDIETLTSQNNVDREEWDEERQQLEKSKTTALDELKEELRLAEEDIKQGLVREDELKKDCEELRDELSSLKTSASQNNIQLDERAEELRGKERDLNEERRRLNVTVEELNLQVTKITTQLEESQRKTKAAERELQKAEMNMTRKSEALLTFERKVDELMAKVVEQERWRDEEKDNLAMLTRENVELKAHKERLQEKFNEEVKRTDDLEQRLREANRGMQNVRVRNQIDDEIRMDRDEKLHILTNKAKQLEDQLADRQAKLHSSGDLMKKMEQELTSMGQELRAEKDKNVEVTQVNESLKQTLRSATEELESVKSALDKKMASSRQANQDLVANYREAEKRFVDMQTECEHLKGHIATLNVKLDRLESKKSDSDRRCDDVDRRNTELLRRLNQYERSAKAALNLARSTSNMRPGTSTVDLPRSSSGLAGGFHMRSATSSADIYTGSPEKSVHFYDEPTLDISSSMDITLKYLKERIQQLERDKEEINNDLNNSNFDLKTTRKRLEEATKLLADMEKKLSTTDNEKHLLESRLASQRQLYLSNEESARSRDSETRALKSKITSLELHMREKDSKMAQMTQSLENARLDLATANGEKEKLIRTAKNDEQELRELDNERNSLLAERNKLQRSLNEVQGDYKMTSKRLEEVESERSRLERTLEDLRKSSDRDRQLLERLQDDERHWRQTAVNAKKTSEDYHKHIYEERLQNLQQTHDALVARCDASNSDSERLRQELRDQSQLINKLNLKISDLESKLSTEKDNINTMKQQLAAFHRFESEWTKLERETRDELTKLRKEKLLLTSEVEELKRIVQRYDVEKKSLETTKGRLDRETAALRKHISALEEEKTRTDSAIRETVNERKAMDKSIAAMERENAELYRNCSQLQSQLQQLEKDNGHRTIDKLVKDQAAMEARLTKLQQDKRQLEMLVEQKEVNFSRKRQMLESQLSLLREQLEVERKRRNVPSGRFERSSDVRVSRTSMQRQTSKSPFRIDLPYHSSSRGCQHQIYGAYERSSTDVIEYCSSVSQYAHERCSSIETLIM